MQKFSVTHTHTHTHGHTRAPKRTHAILPPGRNPRNVGSGRFIHTHEQQQRAAAAARSSSQHNSADGIPEQEPSRATQNYAVRYTCERVRVSICIIHWLLVASY